MKVEEVGIEWRQTRDRRVRFHVMQDLVARQNRTEILEILLFELCQDG